jgi:UDPglucose 6-dehydrogenase
MTVTFIGHGYVGLVSAAVFADLGNTVWVIGHTKEKIENLKKGIIPIYEPGLTELVKRNIKAKRLMFTLEYSPSISQSDVIFIAVGTPSADDGQADLSSVFNVAGKIGQHLKNYSVIATKSTVPVGTNQKIKQIIDKVKPENSEYDIASVPEFLREGQAISDTLSPDRIIIGTNSKKAGKKLVELHRPLLTKGEKPPSALVKCNLETAEMIKYSSNAFLATKISFANAIAELSERVGADGKQVLKAVGLDKRIGSSFLQAGAGYGGSCFPKDIKALITIAAQYKYNFNLLKEVQSVNQNAMQKIAQKAGIILNNHISGSTITVLGLSFKPDTDDIRDAPSRIIIKELLKQGAKVKAYDPIAIENFTKAFGTPKNLEYCGSAFSAVKNSDLLIIVTQWNEFQQLDLKKVKELMRSPNIIDGRNIYEPEKVTELGFSYIGVGR